MSADFLTHQTQPTGWSCVHTCLAMIMNVDANEVIKRLSPTLEPRGLSHMDTIVAMRQFGIMFAPITASSLWEGWHLVTVPSLNHVGGNHAILIYHDDEGEFRVLDPAIGKRYEESGRNLMSWSETVLVKPGGSLDYYDRYSGRSENVDLKKDLKTALQWIADGDDQQGKDLIVDPFASKYFPCVKCRGDGKSDGRVCETCAGKGTEI